jgi:hypothetical protein
VTLNRTACIALTLLTFFSAAASAQATRTWVSGVGDDANPCSRTAPCKTFAGAIAKTASGGEISALDPGGYGAVTITKSITIDGGGQIASIIATNSTSGVVINAPEANVILRNLSMLGAGTGSHGVRVLSARQVHIDNLAVSGFATAVGVAPTGTSVSVLIERARLTQNGTGLSVDGSAASATARLSDSTVLQNASGLVTTGNGSIISYDNNRLMGNGVDGSPTAVIGAHVAPEPIVGAPVLAPVTRPGIPPKAARTPTDCGLVRNP